ncbi:MAG: GlsB/YeaQ/YmgE family stress response membrane protein [Anaerolineaceae bacterium]|nr:GlsB/YeaQ/YmgE family stress response membrane protein [Anaerolineaceae bacterium]
MGIELLIWIVVGAVAGLLASLVMRTSPPYGLVGDMLIGIAGGLLGGFLFNLMGMGAEVTGINLVSILVAFIGSVIILALVRVMRRV